MILYLTVPLIAEFAVSRWDKVKVGFLKAFGMRFMALVAALILFYVVYGGIILRFLDNYNFRHYNDRNTEDVLALTAFLVLAQPFSVLIAFGFKTIVTKCFGCEK